MPSDYFAPSRPLPSQSHLLQTTDPTLGLVLLTRILITAEYPVIPSAHFFLQIDLQGNKP